ncbi:MAG: 16S rRNA (adenine(1518)-N(6)/adenine(1519)-N(6))-dimethyltransferase RsmA [Candidatus Hodarchaeales archaeon]
MVFFDLLQNGNLKEYTRSIVREYALRPKKNYGQNFVTEKKLIDQIISLANIQDKDIIVEVGGGIGTLTYYLLNHSNQVITYEIDPLLASVLKKEFYIFENKLEVISGDFLTKDIVPHTKIVSNLPYAISSPFIWKITNLEIPPEVVVVTLQKEFANHLCAEPGTSDYSRLSVFASYFIKFEKKFDIPSDFFTPKPKVESSIVRGISIKPPDFVKEKDFFHFLTALFCRKHRRVRNNLHIYQKKLPKVQRKNFRDSLDRLEFASAQPVNLSPTQILSLYIEFQDILQHQLGFKTLLD